MKPSVVKPSSIGSSGLPTPRIWKKWSMTQIESKPTSSASRTMPRQRRADRRGAARPGERVDLEAELHRRRVPRRAAAMRSVATSAEEVVLRPA